MKNIILFLFLFLSNCSFSQTGDTVNKFSLMIWDSDFSMAIVMSYSITNDSIEICQKGTLAGEKDTIFLKRALNSRENKILSNFLNSVNFYALKDEYSNPLIIDGDTKRVFLRISNKAEKTINISNYYQKDLANLFKIVNQFVPVELKISYHKRP